ncbi:MAG TPA: hypothetical protein VGP87_05485 [Gemmatimonadales bacterium]|nr:hypothetical protein [Gemmatimonadales bacterium]
MLGLFLLLQAPQQYFCYSPPNLPKVYLSANFASAEPVETVQGAFEVFLKRRYGYTGQAVCKAQLESQVQSNRRLVLAQARSSIVTNTKWNLTNPPPADTAAATALSPRQKDSAAVADLDPSVLPKEFRGRAAAEANRVSRDYCRANAVISGLLDCDCFSRMVLRYRIAHMREYHKATGGEYDGWMLLPNLFYQHRLPCTECLDTPRLSAWAADRARSSYRLELKANSISSAKVERIATCTGTRFAKTFRARPYVSDAPGLYDAAYGACRN